MRLRRVLWCSLAGSSISLIVCIWHVLYDTANEGRAISSGVRQPSSGSTDAKFTPIFRAVKTLAGTKHLPMPIPDTPAVDVDRLSSQDVTVVTAFFDIGQFQKGAGGAVMSSAVYRRWMSIFANIKNPVVAYFDQPSNVDLMKLYRRSLPVNMTRAVLVDRLQMVSFSWLRPRIKEIFEKPGYPRRPPNTDNADYSAAMHAKYELMLRTVAENPFNSRFYCWLDIGLFRELIPRNLAVDNLAIPSDDVDGDGDDVGKKPRILLRLPVGFDDRRIAYTEVNKPSSMPHQLSAEDIIRHDFVWVCGCFFIGRADQLASWSVEYLQAVNRMLDDGWMSTDQQVLYWLFHGPGRQVLQPTTRIQTYSRPPGDSNRYNEWFYLGYLAKEAGESQV